MRETQAIIERVRRVSDDVQQIDLSVDAALAHLEPGQSIMVRPLDQSTWEPYLRDHWLPVDVLPGRVVIQTAATRNYNPGTVMSVLSPVGRAIPIRQGLLHLLLIAEDALPTPFIHAAQTLNGGGVAVTLVLIGTARRYPLELLPPEVEVINGDADWEWPQRVELLGWADQVLAVAPASAQMDVYARLYETINQVRLQSVPDNYVCGFFTGALACGTGACSACMIPSSKDLLACTDGPAIDLKRVRF